jgi:uncharacterized membrane protein YphA (DoxX/SURF4 family)
MSVILTIHGLLRWLIAILAVIVIIKFAYGWLAKKPYEPIDRGLLSGYTISMDINLLLGLILLVVGGLQPMYRIEHATTMILAVAAAHMTAIWRKSDDPARKFRNQLFMVLISLLLVLVGVIRLRGGFIF